MTSDECVEFLRWALPRLGLQWRGFRKVRRQVCRRIERRLRSLGLEDLNAYRARLEADPGEWAELDAVCRVTISRFYRDRGVFDVLVQRVLPELAAAATARGRPVGAWSAGCASGEEPYTLSLAWELAVGPSFPDVSFRVLATDASETMLERARAAAFPESSLRDLPEHWRRRGFVRRGDRWHLRPRFRGLVTLVRHDVRDPAPGGSFDLVLCRNLVFTYFAPSVQREVAATLTSALRHGGVLAVGIHETLPEGVGAMTPWCARPGLYRRSAARAAA